MSVIDWGIVGATAVGLLWFALLLRKAEMEAPKGARAPGPLTQKLDELARKHGEGISAEMGDRLYKAIETVEKARKGIRENRHAVQKIAREMESDETGE